MPQFSLKHLLASTALIAFGVAYLAYATIHGSHPHPLGNIGAVIMFVGSGACIGAGVLNLFMKPWVGALIGSFAAAAFLAYVIATVET